MSGISPTDSLYLLLLLLVCFNSGKIVLRVIFLIVFVSSNSIGIIFAVDTTGIYHGNALLP